MLFTYQASVYYKSIIYIYVLSSTYVFICLRFLIPMLIKFSEGSSAK